MVTYATFNNVSNYIVQILEQKKYHNMFITKISLILDDIHAENVFFFKMSSDLGFVLFIFTKNSDSVIFA